MKTLPYGCIKENLCPALQKVFHKKNSEKEAAIFQKKKSPLYFLKLIIFVMMSSLGWKHYDTMGILGYETFLLSKKQAHTLIGESKKKRKLLDIGAGNGSVTKKFESYISRITCIEPSISFQKILKKRGYKISDITNKDIYDVVTLFNVLDRCENPDEMIQFAHDRMSKNGICIVSLPFPINVDSWDNNKIKNSNILSQPGKMLFEEAVSSFYTEFLKKNKLQVIYFTRLPYIVSRAETEETIVYDNGLFVCKKYN